MRRSRSAARARLVVLVGVVLVLFVVAAGALRGDGPVPGVAVVATPPGGDEDSDPIPDPFAYDPDDEAELIARAAAGTSHALYARSPGGAAATARRVERWRPQVEAAAEAAGVPADMLEALVFLESAGRADAMAGGSEGAVGLTQIVAETGTSLLGMQIDIAHSARLTRRIARAAAAGDELGVQRLSARRRVVDERYDAEAALDATARYLVFARETLGREDLALEAYHMGVGNLQDVLEAYGESSPSYARLYFDSTPARHREVQQRLAAFGDESSTYYFKLHAAREIMRLHRDDPAELARLEGLHGAKNSAEEVLHPLTSTPTFDSPGDLKANWDDGFIRALPDDPAATGLSRDARMGELATRIGVPAGLYRGLRPEALATALYIGAQTREYAGGAGPLVVTSTVRDKSYQSLLVRRNREATRNFSLHTTGWSFDIARQYRSKAQALAFQFVLDRLQVLNVIAWVREPGAIHVTAAGGVDALLPLLDRIDP